MDSEWKRDVTVALVVDNVAVMLTFNITQLRVAT